MTNKAILTLFCGFLFSFFVAAQGTIPNVSVKTLEGESINLSEYMENDKTYVLSFWATWCKPCKKELDAISELYDVWQEDFNVELIAVSIDNARALAKVKPLVVEKDWSYTVLTDQNQALFQALNATSVPQTYVINGSGEIVYSHTGYVPGDEYELEDKLAALAEK